MTKAKTKRRYNTTVILTDEEAKKLADEGADPRLTARQARFHALVGRCVGAKPGAPLSDESVEFIKKMDEACATYARKAGIETRDD